MKQTNNTNRTGRALVWAVGLLCVAPWSGRSQSLTQTLNLQPGWNSVYLEVTPADPVVGHVFSDPAIDSIWEPKVRVTTVSFIQNQNEVPFNRGGWSVYVPTNRPESLNNDLYNVRANHAYLVKVAGSAPVTVAVTGRPSLRQLAFAPDAFTLRGFAVDPASPPTFQTFFKPSAGHYDVATGTLQRIYRLNNGTAQWELVAPSDLMQRGAAYWVYTVGASSYQAPLTATPNLGDGLDFGQTSSETDLTLRNQTAAPMNVTITDLGTDSRPLSYFYTPTNQAIPAWVPLPQTYTRLVMPGAVQTVRLGLQRSQMAGNTYATVLSVSDGSGTQLRVAVTAQRPIPNTGGQLRIRADLGQPMDATAAGAIPVALQAGLWVGDVTVNAVAETYNNPTNTTPTKGAFDLRVIMHVTTNGVTRLLREVIQMYQNGTYTNNAAGQRVVDQPGQSVLLTDDTLLSQYTGVALRDRTPVGRRISTAGFDFDPSGGTNFLTMNGTFGVGNTVGCTINLLPTTPTNPFLHRYHPDHDGLDPLYNPLPKTNVVQEVYTITRQIQMQFTATDPTGQTASDYGYNEIGGTYGETITGLHRNPLVTSGIFHLRRIVDTPVLNQNQ